MKRVGMLKALAGGILLTLCIGLFTDVEAGHRRRCRCGGFYAGYPTTGWNYGVNNVPQTACAGPDSQMYDGSGQPGAYGQPMNQQGQPGQPGYQSAPPPPPPNQDNNQ